MSDSLRDASRKTWNSDSTVNDINAGSLQRIADGIEKMAGSYSAIITERDRYQRWYEEEREKVQRRDNQIRSLRGVITRMKRAAHE